MTTPQGRYNLLQWEKCLSPRWARAQEPKFSQLERKVVDMGNGQLMVSSTQNTDPKIAVGIKQIRMKHKQWKQLYSMVSELDIDQAAGTIP